MTAVTPIHLTGATGERHLLRLFRRCNERDQERFVVRSVWPDLGHERAPTEAEVRAIVESLRERAAEVLR